MKTEDLIADLAGRLTPVRALRPPGVRALGWLAFASACVVGAVTLLGARPDVLVRLTQLDYLGMALLASLTSTLAVVMALVLAIPGAERSAALRMFTVAIVGVWAVSMAGAVYSSGHGLPVSTDPHWPVCFTRVLLVSALPALVLFALVRRGVSLRPGWTAAMAALAAASVGALAVQIACPLDDPGHSFLGHFVPVLSMAVIGVAAQRLFARPVR